MHRFARSLLPALALAAFVTAFAVSPLTADAQAASGAPAIVGVLYPIKTILGQQGRRSAELAAEMINASGGVAGGQPMKLVVYDDNYSAADGVAAARRLSSEDKAPIVVGTINSAVALGVMQVAQQNGQLFLAAITKAPQVTDYDRAFRFNPLVATDGEMFNKYLKDVVKPQRVVVVVENGDYGRSIVADMKAAFGDKLVGSELYEILKQTDFSTLATRVKTAAPDLVCIAMSAPEQGGNLLRTLKEVGVPGRRCVLPGSVSPSLVQVAGPAAEGVFTLDIWAPSMKNEANTRFVTAFTAKYKEAPNKVDYLGFESMWILGQAMRKAGTNTDTAKLASTLRDNAWDTPRGEVRFVKNQAVSPTWVTLVVKDGQIVTD
ncbi:MAG: Extracellular ligand-binding receptor [Rhizobacter sp.]|nr:Extracellular ligand-binding receptor [Rhizobacter sp.]